MAGGGGSGSDPSWDAGPKFASGDWIAFAKSSDSGGLGASDGVLELTLSWSGEENEIGCPGLCPACRTTAEQDAAIATLARSGHRVKCAKLKPISSCQASSFDNPRQNEFKIFRRAQPAKKEARSMASGFC
jgi:hypothetical protein